jgi:hypothetical protein
MIAFALTALFTSVALLALAAITQSWRQYGMAALAIRSALKQGQVTRNFEYRIISLDAASPKPARAAAQIIALPIRPSLRHPRPQPALRAAA